MPNGFGKEIFPVAGGVPPPIVPPPPAPPTGMLQQRKQFWQNNVNTYRMQAQIPILPILTPTTEQRVQEYKKLSFWQQLMIAPAFMQRASVPPGIQTELPKQVLARQKQVSEQAALSMAKAQWFVDFYDSAPILVANDKVSSYNDYIRILGVDTPEYISQQDIAEANEAIATLSTKKVEGKLPEFMEVEPGQEAAVREFLEHPTPTAIPVSINRLTIDEIKKALTTPATARLPEGMTEEELFRVASLLGIPEDTVKAVLDIDETKELLAKAAQEQQTQIGEVLAGIREWEAPKTSMWERLLFIAQQPMQAVADIMKPYLENVSYPLAGGASYLVSKLISGEQDIERLYNQKRAAGINPWSALGQAEQEWDLPWYWKLLIELPTDPLTYIPGLALSLPGKALIKASGVAGGRFGLGAMKAFGRGMIAVNDGLYRMLDIVPSAAKAVWSRFPKSFDQIIRSELDTFMQNELYPAVSKVTGKAIHQITPEDISKTMNEAVRAFKAAPTATGDALVDFGRSLSDFIPLSKDKIAIWSKSRGGDVTVEFTTARIAEVNDIIRDTLMKVGSPAENAKRMAIALVINDTPETIGRLIKDIATYSDKLSTNIARATQIGKQATAGGVSQMLGYLKTRQADILKVTVKGQSADGNIMKGLILGLQNGLDKVQNHSFRIGIDRFTVRPLAEAYLGNISYPFWNALEGMAISIIEGVVPGFPRREAFLQMTKGLMGLPADLVAHAASEPIGMLGKRTGITLLPGGKVGQWFGRKWIDLSNDWGNALRANFVMKRMSKYLVEKLYDVEGHDLNAVLNRITRGAPKVAKSRLGLTQDELQRMVRNRLLAEGPDSVRALKTILTDGSMSKAEQLRIIRKYTLMSPTAKDMAEEVIGQGAILANNDTILEFAQKVADQSISDLRHYPIDVADSFRQLATDISGREMTTLDDLMDVFQTYEVMSTTASNIPNKLMAETSRKADALYAGRKFSQVEQLWRTDRQQMIDTMAQVSGNMESVRMKITENVGKLTPDQQAAMNVVLDRSSAGDTLREATLRADGQLLDDFWALPGKQRTEAEHTALRAYRTEQWLKYRQEAAEIGAGEMLSRKEFAKLYQKLPEPRLIPVDATSRALSADDVAKIMGCNIDALSSGIAENMVMQDKVFFTELVRQTAEANPTLFRGITPEKIESAYDDILRGMRISPEMEVSEQKILMQMEGMKQELMTLRMVKSLKPDEEKALAGWIDNVASGAEKEMYTTTIVGKKAVTTLKPEYQSLNTLRQEALDSSLKDYYKTFADYTNPNIVDAAMKMIYPYWCIPEYATILTRDGWKHYTKLIVGEDVLTINPNTLETQWEPVTEVAVFDYDADLMVIPAKGKDIKFTPNHRWLVVNKLHGELPKIKRGYELTEGYDAIPRALPHKFPSNSILSPRDAALLGWVWTDGWYQKQHGRNRPTFFITQSLDNYLLEIEKLCGKKGRFQQPSGYSHEDSKCFNVRLKQEDSDRLLNVCPDKSYLPRVVSQLSREAAETMWDAMFKAEGSDYSGNRCWIQKNGPVMDAFQLLSVLLGKAISANKRDGIGRVNLLSNHLPYNAKECRRMTTEHYTGKVWCPVTPSGTWFMNCNGSIVPTGNTYTFYKWFMLPRLAMKHPGLMAAWGKYYNYSDQGYQHIPSTDLEANPFTGSMFGTTFGLARHDFVSYYSNLGWMGEVLDWTQRAGAFPGAHIMLPIVLTPIFSGRPPELGEALPSLPRAGLGMLVGSNIPGVSKAAKWLQDKVFHSNLQDYYTTTIVSTKQVESGGKLVEGQSGTDLWYKKLRKESFTPEEQQLWDESYREAAWYGVVRSQFPQLRLRTEEYLDAYKQITTIFQERLGMSEEFQDNLWKHNKRPTDVVGGLPLDLRQTLDEMWQWRIYFGRGVTMMPPDVQDLYSLIDEYFGATKTAQQNRLTNEANIDAGFITPTPENHWDGREWRGKHAENWADYSKNIEDLKNSPRFASAIDALTPEGQVKLMKRLNFSTPTLGPMDEALDLYFNIKLEKEKDKYTGEEDYNYLKFWLQREAVKMALPEDLRADFEDYIRKYETPMERTFRTAYNSYIRGYHAASRIILSTYNEEQKALIAEYYADTTTSVRRGEIESIVGPDGNKLISGYTHNLTQARSAMRQVSPKLDFWLNVFGYLDSRKTPEATAMLDAFERDKTSILQ